MRAGGQGYLWPWALVFMWSRILMACLSRPSTLRKYTLLSTKLFTALKQKGVRVSSYPGNGSSLGVLRKGLQR